MIYSKLVVLILILTLTERIYGCLDDFECYPKILNVTGSYDLVLPSDIVKCTENAVCKCSMPCFTLASDNHQCQLIHTHCVTFDFDKMQCVDQRMSKVSF